MHFLTHVFSWFLGSCFARDATCSHRCCPSSTDHHSTFVSEVLVGDFVQGNHDYHCLPTRSEISDFWTAVQIMKKKSFHLCHLWEAPDLPGIHLGGYAFILIKVMSEVTMSHLEITLQGSPFLNSVLHIRTSYLTFSYTAAVSLTGRKLQV